MTSPRASIHAVCTACAEEIQHNQKVYHVGKATAVTEERWSYRTQVWEPSLRLDRRGGSGKVYDIFCEDCYVNFVESIKSLKVIADILSGKEVTSD